MTRLGCFLVPWIVLCGLLAGRDAAGADRVPGMEDLYRLDLLPRFKPSLHVASVSSYDRSGGNDDGFSGKYSFVRKEPEGLVIADLQPIVVQAYFQRITKSQEGITCQALATFHAFKQKAGL